MYEGELNDSKYNGQGTTYYENGGKMYECEFKDGERTVCQNDDWLVVVPYWAAWPFETLLLPRFSIKQLTELTEQTRQSLADILKQLTTRYDNLFKCSFPY